MFVGTWPAKRTYFHLRGFNLVFRFHQKEKSTCSQNSTSSARLSKFAPANVSQILGQLLFFGGRKTNACRLDSIMGIFDSATFHIIAALYFLTTITQK
jgi:uncharacterized heparinase superfamily protein